MEDRSPDDYDRYDKEWKRFQWCVLYQMRKFR